MKKQSANLSSSEVNDKANAIEKRYNLHEFWDHDHWEGVKWPQVCLESEISFGHPAYRYLPLTWMDVMVTLKTGATRLGTVVQVFSPWIHCIVQLEPNLPKGCYPFRVDKVRPWDLAPVPWSGKRFHDHLEVVGKDEEDGKTKKPKATKIKKVTRKQVSQQIINRNNMF